MEASKVVIEFVKTVAFFLGLRQLSLDDLLFRGPMHEKCDHVLMTELRVVAHCNCRRRLLLAELNKENF
jgi:hypothetical protein